MHENLMVLSSNLNISILMYQNSWSIRRWVIIRPAGRRRRRRWRQNQKQEEKEISPSHSWPNPRNGSVIFPFPPPFFFNVTFLILLHMYVAYLHILCKHTCAITLNSSNIDDFKNKKSWWYYYKVKRWPRILWWLLSLFLYLNLFFTCLTLSFVFSKINVVLINFLQAV